jgi:glycosyltransferase involved in cell wall biosynthesis
VSVPADNRPVSALQGSGVRAVAIVPTYNNAPSVRDVLVGLWREVNDILVVIDGSTDATSAIVNDLKRDCRGPQTLTVLEFESNRGKGAALREGFKKALSIGCTHAITVDADGQHIPGDVVYFLEKIYESPDTLWIGDRTIPFNDSQQPLRSRLGRVFGAFWYRFFTDKKIRDTQCGFRAYPLEPINNLGCTGNGYDFEQELLIHAAWNGIPVKSVPIHLYYPPRDKAVSHFRPFTDFMRIFKVNSKAALTKIFLPWRTMGISGRGWKYNLVFMFRNAASPNMASRSVAMGVFVGILPIYGFQVAFLTAMTPVLRLNWPLAFLGANVSCAPLLPFVIAAGIAVGKIVVPRLPFTPPSILWAHAFAKGGVEWFVGSIVIAVCAGVLVYGLSYPVFLRLAKKRKADK